MFSYKCLSKDCSKNWIIVVNGRECRCNKSVAVQNCSKIRSFVENEIKQNSYCEINIPDIQNDDYIRLISKLLCGEYIVFNSTNYPVYLAVGKSLDMLELVAEVEKYEKYLNEIRTYLKGNLKINEMKEMEMILLLLTKENLEIYISIIVEYIKHNSTVCFIHFTLSFCFHCWKMEEKYTLICCLMEKIDSFLPGTTSLFIKIVFQIFMTRNPIIEYGHHNINRSLCVNLLVLEMFKRDLLKKINIRILICKSNVLIPTILCSYFAKYNNIFHYFEESEELACENIKKNEEEEEEGQYGEEEDINDHYKDKKGKNDECDESTKQNEYVVDCLRKAIENDDCDYFQELIVKFGVEKKEKIKLQKDNCHKEDLVLYTAYFGSIKCFNYLMNNKFNVDKGKLSRYAVAGGNFEIVQICQRENCVFDQKALNKSIKYHHHKITKWLMTTKNLEADERTFKSCFKYSNIKSLILLIENGHNLEKMLVYSCKYNNMNFVNFAINLLKKKENSLCIIHTKPWNNCSALHIACENDNVEIVSLLLDFNQININEIRIIPNNI